jgi:uncharacterized protein YhfF
MGPGNVLVGLVKKIVAGARTATCGTVAEVQQLLELAGTASVAKSASDER